MTRSSWSLSTRIISVQMSGQGPCARYKLLSDLIIDESDFLFHEIIYRFFILHKDTDPGLQRKTIPSTSTVIVSSQMTTLSTENSSQNVQQERKRTPLPKLQLFITNLIQFAEPVTALVIYPFINQFVRDTGITNGDETKTGYYAGVIVSHQESVDWIIFLRLNLIGIHFLPGGMLDRCSVGISIRPVRS